MHRRRGVRTAFALLAVTGVTAALAVAAGSAGAAVAAQRAAAPQITFGADPEPGWYLVKTSAPTPVSVTLELGSDCNFVSGVCHRWTTFPVRRFAAGDTVRVSWLEASFWGQARNRAGKDVLRSGFYRMTFAVPGKPASAVQTRWQLSFGG